MLRDRGNFSLPILLHVKSLNIRIRTGLSGTNVLRQSVQDSVENQSKQFEYFVRFPESDGPWFEDPKADAVQHVENEKQVKKLIKKKEPMLLMFYTPWCSACKTVKKEFVIDIF